VTTWTVEKELCDLAEATDVNSAANKLGLLSGESYSHSVTRVDWEPGGSETYIFVFDAVSDSGHSQRLIFKAFVPFPGVTSVATALHDTMTRSKHLEAHGVNVARCFGGRHGTALFEYIPQSLSEALRTAEPDSSQERKLIRETLRLAIGVVAAGYRPIGLCHDLRTDGERVYMVDLGSDLGAPRTIGTTPDDGFESERLKPHVLHWLRQECRGSWDLEALWLEVRQQPCTSAFPQSC